MLQVLPALEAGGVERGTIEIAAALKAAGWGAMVASAGGAMARELDRLGVPHLTLPLQRKNPLQMRRNAESLANAIREHGVGLVHARSRAPAWSAWAAARRTGVPFVTTFHNAYGHNWLKHPYNAVMARGRRVIAISNFVAEHVRATYGVPEARLVTIQRGVDLGLFSPQAVSAERQIQLLRAWRLPEATPVVMLPGRLTRWKGQMVLLEALARMPHRNLVCVLVGSDQGRERYRRELERRAEALGLGAQLRIVPHCRDMPAAYMLADVVVSASTQPEGFGRVAAEALAMGRPVVATDHGGARETVLPRETGWLVPPGDAAALAAALEVALSLDPGERRWLAERARAHVTAHFSTAQMCERTLDVYRAVLAGHEA